MGGPGYGPPMNSPYLDPAAADNMEGKGFASSIKFLHSSERFSGFFCGFSTTGIY